MNDARAEILDALKQLHAAQEAHDLDAMLSMYSTQGFVSAEDMRTYFEGLIKQDAFRTRTVDLTKCETFVYRGNTLTAAATTPSMSRRTAPSWPDFKAPKLITMSNSCAPVSRQTRASCALTSAAVTPNE